MLRASALKIIRALGVEGGCNVQFALDPESFQYYVIEVNPRVSRSSALASKATGYPIARCAAKIAVGFTLDEIPNPVTGKTCACFEPAIDYVVVKIPRWPFDKFGLADRTLGTQMKATGEVMALGRSFEEALLKAVRSLEIGVDGLTWRGCASWSEMELQELLSRPNDLRLFALAEAFRRCWPVKEVYNLTKVDYFFLEKIKNIVVLEGEMRAAGWKNMPAELLLRAKRAGFADSCIARLTGCRSEDVWQRREKLRITPVYKMVDTCAAEFEAATPYYYSTYELAAGPTGGWWSGKPGKEEEKGKDERSSRDESRGEGLGAGEGGPEKGEFEGYVGKEETSRCRLRVLQDEVRESAAPKIMVIGSGPIRIGQGIEFDYCSVHAVWAIREMGYEAVIINNNPETVSTDFDTADRLYFEPLTLEDVWHVIQREQVAGVLVQFGGQTAINLAAGLVVRGAPLLGTPLASIDIAEDREKFARFLRELNIPQSEGGTAFTVREAVAIAERLGYPVLVRPSYVLGGRAMEIVYNTADLMHYMETAVQVSPQHPVLVDKYIQGREVEVDAIGDGRHIFIPGIMEHIEQAGVHSGDSMAVYPPVNLSAEEIRQVVDYTLRIGKALGICGLINIQYVIAGGRVYVLEVNPRASRTVPILSKVTGVPMVKVAVQAILGRSLPEQGYGDGLGPWPRYYAVKAPVFSFEKLSDVEISLGPEMKSTGEVMGVDPSLTAALYKAMVAAGVSFNGGGVLLSLADRDKPQGAELARQLSSLGFRLLATPGTARVLRDHGLAVQVVERIEETVRSGAVGMVINTPTRGKQPARAGFRLRRLAADYKVPCFTALDTARAAVQVLAAMKGGEKIEPVEMREYCRGK